MGMPLFIPLPAQAVAVQVGDSARLVVSPGTRVGIPLRLDPSSSGGALALASLSGTLAWGSERITFDSVRVNSTAGFTQNANASRASAGTLELSYFSASGSSSSVVLATAWYTASAAAGSTRLTFAPSAAGNTEGSSILGQVFTRATDLCVRSNGRWGDVNEDGTVSIIDAQQIARSSVGLSVASASAVSSRGDVNADGTVSIIDAQQIARFTVGLSAAARINTSQATPPTVASASVSPSGAQSLQVGASIQLLVTPRDGAGADVSGCVPVAFRSSAPAVATVSSDGVVTGISAGTTSISAEVGTSTVITSFTVLSPGVAYRVTATSLSPVAGTAVTITAQLVDAGGNAVASAGRTVTWTKSHPSGSFATPTSTTSASGAATVAFTTHTLAGTEARVTATDNALPTGASGTSAVITSQPGTSANLALTTPAAGATSGSAFASQPVVAIRDANGNTVTGSAAAVTMTVSTGSTVVGTATVTAVNGVATFTNVGLSGATGSYTLTFASPGLAAAAQTVTLAPGAPAQLSIAGGAGQIATVASILSTAPRVLVRDAANNPVPGVSVTFTAFGGGGSVTGGTQITNASGIATVGAWRLGTVAGMNTLRATVSGLSALDIFAIGLASAPASYAYVAGAGQIEAVGTVLPITPVVRVEDQYRNPVSGVQVSFSITSGGGSIGAGRSSTSVMTNADGLATPDNWRLGPATGFNVLRATIPGMEALTVRARAVQQSEFPIDVRYVAGGAPSAEIQALINAAVVRVRKVFVLSAPLVLVNQPAGACGATSPAINESVRGVVVFADVRSIDGPGGTLGSATSCLFRTSPRMTALGMMRLDADDLSRNIGSAYETIVHELLHVMGFGIWWNDFGLVSGASTTDPWFNGASATSFFNLMGGAGYLGNKVPIEDVGGSGTRLLHWRSSLMTNELMTGFACRPKAPLSLITLASFADMGISIAWFGDDDFMFSASPCTTPLASRAREEPSAIVPRFIDVATGRILTAEETRAAIRATPKVRLPRREVPEQVLERSRRR
jgi:hypothetical protein